jgi:formate hydrogenlyase subunit 6/NADH:ubiquinone oxidoreductase subunit I
MRLRDLFRPLPPARAEPGASPPPSGGHLLQAARCTACKACQAACPATCIEVIAIAEAFGPARFRIDQGRCICCYRCVEVCPELCLLPGPAPVPPTPRRQALVQTLWPAPEDPA